MDTIKKKVDKVKKRYGKTITKIPKQKKKPKWKIKPTRISKKYGLKASIRF